MPPSSSARRIGTLLDGAHPFARCEPVEVGRDQAGVDGVHPDLVYRPVTDASPYTVSVTWPTGSRSRDLAAFVRIAMEVAEHQHVAA